MSVGPTDPAQPLDPQVAASLDESADRPAPLLEEPDTGVPANAPTPLSPPVPTYVPGQEPDVMGRALVPTYPMPVDDPGAGSVAASTDAPSGLAASPVHPEPSDVGGHTYRVQPGMRMMRNGVLLKEDAEVSFGPEEEEHVADLIAAKVIA
jgi:hypothetical protein